MNVNVCAMHTWVDTWAEKYKYKHRKINILNICNKKYIYFFFNKNYSF